MNADVAIGKAIGELDWNKPDRAQVWALIAIAEAILETGRPDLPAEDILRRDEATPQDAPHATHGDDELDPAPQDQPVPTDVPERLNAEARRRIRQRQHATGTSFEALFAPPKRPGW